MAKKIKWRPEVIQALLLFLFALVFFSNWYRISAFNIFQGRDIRRALEILQGNLIWYGPDLSGGSHTPGPFYYWLLALPLKVFGSWQSLVWLNLVLMSTAAVVMWFVGTALCSSFTGFILFFAFLTSRFLTGEISSFWNPSFLFIFQAMIVYWSVKTPQKRIYPIFIGIFLGLTLQIHYVQAVFLFGLISSLVWQDNWSKKKFKTIFMILGCSFVPLLPYFIWLFGQSTQAVTAGATSTLLFPVVRLFDEPALFFSRVGTNISTYFSKEVARETLFPFMCWSWLMVILLRIQKIKVPVTKNRFLWLSWAFSALICIPAIYDFAFLRYSGPFILLSYVLSVPQLDWLEKRYRPYFLGAIAINFAFELWMYAPHFSNLTLRVFLLVLVLTGLTIAMFFSFQLTGRQRLALAPFWALSILIFIWIPTTEPPRQAREREKLLEIIIQKTGWDYKTFRERTFVVGVHQEEEFQVIYEQIRNSQPATKPADFDGILIVYGKRARFLEGGKPNWENILYEVPVEISSFVARGDLSCKETFVSGYFDVCLYKFKDPSIHYTWNNLGYPYLFQQPPLVSLKESAGALRLDKSRWIFYKNGCATFEPACTIYFLVESFPKKYFEITVLGDPLAVPNPAPNPAWYFTIKDPRIEFECQGKKSSYIFSSLLGNNLNSNDTLINGFLVPYQARVPLSCVMPDNISVVIENGFSANIYRSWKTEAFRLTWKGAD